MARPHTHLAPTVGRVWPPPPWRSGPWLGASLRDPCRVLGLSTWWREKSFTKKLGKGLERWDREGRTTSPSQEGA